MVITLLIISASTYDLKLFFLRKANKKNRAENTTESEI